MISDIGPHEPDECSKTSWCLTRKQMLPSILRTECGRMALKQALCCDGNEADLEELVAASLGEHYGQIWNYYENEAKAAVKFVKDLEAAQAPQIQPLGSLRIKESRFARLVRSALPQANDKPPHFIVYVQGIDRCFGGREEGGWYYDRTEVVGAHHAWGCQTLYQVLEYLMEEFPSSKHGRFSVLGGTDYEFAIRMSDEDAPISSPSGRPTYE